MNANKNSMEFVRPLTMRDLRKVYAHARQMGWTIGNYGIKSKSLENLTVAIQNEFSRRGQKLPY